MSNKKILFYKTTSKKAINIDIGKTIEEIQKLPIKKRMIPIGDHTFIMADIKKRDHIITGVIGKRAEENENPITENSGKLNTLVLDEGESILFPTFFAVSSDVVSLLPYSNGPAKGQFTKYCNVLNEKNYILYNYIHEKSEIERLIIDMSSLKNIIFPLAGDKYFSKNQAGIGEVGLDSRIQQSIKEVGITLKAGKKSFISPKVLQNMWENGNYIEGLKFTYIDDENKSRTINIDRYTYKTDIAIEPLKAYDVEYITLLICQKLEDNINNLQFSLDPNE